MRYFTNKKKSLLLKHLKASGRSLTRKKEKKRCNKLAKLGARMLAEEASESTDQLPGRTKAWSRHWRWQTIASKISLPNGTVRKPKLTLLWFSIFAKMSNFVPHACSFANEGCRAQVRCWPQRSPSLAHTFSPT